MNSTSSNESSNPLACLGNGSVLPPAFLSMLAARNQSSTPPPIEQINAKHNSGIFVRDAAQINSDISKLASVVAAAAGETMVSFFSKQNRFIVHKLKLQWLVHIKQSK